VGYHWKGIKDGRTSLVRYYCLEGSSRLTGLAPSGYHYPVVVAWWPATETG